MMNERKRVAKQRLKRNPEQIMEYKQKEALDCFICEKYAKKGIIVYDEKDDCYVSLCDSCKNEIEKES